MVAGTVHPSPLVALHLALLAKQGSTIEHQSTETGMTALMFSQHAAEQDHSAFASWLSSIANTRTPHAGQEQFTSILHVFFIE